MSSGQKYTLPLSKIHFNFEQNTVWLINPIMWVFLECCGISCINLLLPNFMRQSFLNLHFPIFNFLFKILHKVLWYWLHFSKSMPIQESQYGLQFILFVLNGWYSSSVIWIQILENIIVKLFCITFPKSALRKPLAS